MQKEFCVQQVFDQTHSDRTALNTRIVSVRHEFIVNCPMCHYVLLASKSNLIGTNGQTMDNKSVAAQRVSQVV